MRDVSTSVLVYEQLSETTRILTEHEWNEIYPNTFYLHIFYHRYWIPSQKKKSAYAIL